MGDRRHVTLEQTPRISLSAVWLARIVAEVIAQLEQAPQASTRIAGPANALRREGDTWLITYAGTAVRIRDAKGVRDLAILLARPGVEFHAADLVAAAERRIDVETTVAGMGGRAAAQAGLRVYPGQAAAVALDPQARREYHRRITELHEEIAEAEQFMDSERATRSRYELEALSREVARSYGLGGRARALADPANRMRKAVAARLRSVIARLQSLHPALAAHLDKAVRTGMFCAYMPSQPTSWTITEHLS
jgi:hypothetical protein